MYGKSRPSAIAKAIGLTPATLTYLSRKLIAKKLVMREETSQDQRVKYLVISNEGRTILDKASEDGKLLRKQLIEKLTEDEFHAFLLIYRKLAAMLQAT